MNQQGKTGRSWYLVMSKPRQEFVARENLERQGYEVYLPRLHARKRRNGKFVRVIEPMFPRYLFIHLDQSDDNWAPIRSTYGVSNIVYFGFQPASVSDQLVQALMNQDDEEGIQVLPEVEIVKGDSIRIVEGVMAGYEGIYQAKSGKERVSILLQIAGNAAEIQVPSDHIERAS